MKLKITCIFFLIITIQQLSYAQTSNANNKIIPPPPNVASLIKIADVPVSAYTGMAGVTIPLYTIDEGDLKIPISMTYSSNGLKVTEEAGEIGLGWSLNAGGVIHQNVVGNPDDYLPSQEGYWPMPKNMPVVSNSDILENNRLERGSVYLDNQSNQHTLSADIITYGSNHEFDQYLYNFGPYSGKFILPNYPLSTEVAMLDRNNIQITYSFGNTFTATTPDGTQYIFSTIGKTNTPNSTCNATANLTSYSYYLTQIISPNGRVATFTYKKYVSNSLPSLSQSFTSATVGGAAAFTLSEGFFANIVYAYSNGGTTISDVTSIGTSQQENLILDNITTANTTVKFNTSPRQDVDQGVELDNISVYRVGETTPFKGFAFGYSYFQGVSSYGDWTTDPYVILSNCGTKNGISPTLISERLKLNTVQFLGNAGASEPPYQFLYDPTPLPYKTSLSQDLWGYFNGSTSHSLLPDYNNLSYFDNNIPVFLLQLGINKTLGTRNTVPQYLQAGILKKIINPTGGYTKITYEPNQFGNLPSQNNQVRDTIMSVTDHGVGTTQLEFDVPDIGYTTINPPNATPASYNPALINVLFIKGDNTGCTISPGYNAYNYTNGVGNNNALYALLEKWDPVNSAWTLSANNIYDANNPAINSATGGGPCQVQNLAQLLVPGHYRITANFPDAQPGALPSPSASISVSYKYLVSQTLPNFGGGLRVKSVTEYTDVNHPYNQKIYNYYGGRLMTRPIFYRAFLNIDADYRALTLPNDPNTVLSPCHGLVNNAPGIPLPQYTVSLYSNPVLNYSYSASGAIVGYDNVTVDYSTNKEIGETSYSYNNSADQPCYYPDILPGEQGATNIFNGTLTSTVFNKMNANGVLSPVKAESNVYGVTNFQDYWAYKSEYVPGIFDCGGGAPYSDGSQAGSGITPVQGINLYFNYLHFYPVKAGNVHIISKTETSYDGVTPTTVSTNYQYNLFNQLSTVSVSKSDGRNDIQQTYYPKDVSSYYPAPAFITQMIAKNMIDYPIETIHSINSLTSTLTAGASFTEYYQHDNNIISPLNSYKLKLKAPFSFTPFISNNTRDPNYELRESFSYDAFGNLIQSTPTGGASVNYLWDYNNTYPVAQITNAVSQDFAYTSFEASSQGNWNYAGTPALDNTCPTGKYSYSLSGGSITKSNMTSSKTYTLSYWLNVNTPLSIAGTVTGSMISVRSNNGWYFYRQNITGVTGITISGSSKIDELRLYPVDAQMKTFTYEPSIGVSSATDEKGNTMIYEYDPLQNLQNVKDLNGNVMKNYAYNYAQPGTNISNHQLSQVFTKNNCGPGFAGPQVTYTVPAGKYISYVSQADADDMAQDDINDYGQAYANLNGGSCTFLPCQSPQISVVKNGTNGYTITYTSSGGATSAVLIITDTNGNVVTQQPAVSPAGGVVSGTVPTTGLGYSFVIRGFGSNCPSGVVSNTFKVTY